MKYALATTVVLILVLLLFVLGMLVPMITAEMQEAFRQVAP